MVEVQGFVVKGEDGALLELWKVDVGISHESQMNSRLRHLLYSHALRRVVELGMGKVIIETDVAELKKALTSEEMDPHDVNGALFRQIQELMILEFD